MSLGAILVGLGLLAVTVAYVARPFRRQIDPGGVVEAWVAEARDALRRAGRHPGGIVLLLSILSAFTSRPFSVQAQSPPGVVVTGRVTMLTADAGVPVGLAVRLRRFVGPHELESIQSEVGDDGGYHFAPPPPGPDEVYVVQADYAGVSYFSEPVAADAEETELVIPVSIAEVTDDPSGLRIHELQWVLVATPERLYVAESYLIANRSDRTYAGPAPGGVTFELTIPDGATDVRPLNDSTGDRYRIDETSIADTYPIMPGEVGAQVQISYALPYRDGMVLTREMPLDTEGVWLMLPDRGVAPVAAGLRPGEPIETAMGMVDTYELDGLAAGDPLRVALIGEPVAAEDATVDGITDDAAGDAERLPVRRHALNESVLGALLLAAALVIAYMIWAGAPVGPIPARLQPLVDEIAAMDIRGEREGHVDRLHRADRLSALRRELRNEVTNEDA
ncbi:MAG TPA: hypothetical protein GX702_03020 [Chloroflexi bacterium]|jgi:hypothetical protein|nr:hypothetical protein [Chloroflexota bacterium]